MREHSGCLGLLEQAAQEGCLAPLATQIQDDVLSDAAITQRVDLALWALTHAPTPTFLESAHD